MERNNSVMPHDVSLRDWEKGMAPTEKRGGLTEEDPDEKKA